MYTHVSNTGLAILRSSQVQTMVISIFQKLSLFGKKLVQLQELYRTHIVDQAEFLVKREIQKYKLNKLREENGKLIFL